MRGAFRFRLYPSLGQEARMLGAIEASRRLWNVALEHRKTRWENEHQSTSYNLQASILTFERKEDMLLDALYSQIGQDVLRRLDRAFKSFFSGRARYPRFKKFSESGSFTYPQAYNGSAKPDVARKRLFLSKIGNVRTVFHRPPPKYSLLKTCTVIREPDGKWFASLVFEECVRLQNIDNAKRAITSPIGIDLGLVSLVTTSDDEKLEHPRFLGRAEKRLKHAQRSFSRKKKNSKNYFKARRRVASVYSRVRRQRLDYNHKLSTRLVRGHSFIAFEDLRVSNMIRNRVLAKSIGDAAWGQLVRLAEYKALKAGSRVVRVPAAYSTQECYHCGALNEIDLDTREFVCIGCGHLLRRDYNAARVVLKRGLAIAGLTTVKVGQDLPELKPAETRPLSVQTTGGASQVIETGTIGPQGLEAHGL
jgi:putative transposase